MPIKNITAISLSKHDLSNLTTTKQANLKSELITLCQKYNTKVNVTYQR